MLSRIFVLVLFVFTTTTAATACSTLNLAQANKPVVVIASPPSGSQFAEGDTVSVQSTATDPTGIVRVELLVDSTTVETDPAPTPQGQPSFSVLQRWKAILGTHTLSVRAVNAAGTASEPAAILITVSSAATPTATAPAAPAAATLTATATALALVTPTNTPIPVTLSPACPGPPVIGSFDASPSTITSGDATTLSWGAVKNATAATIDHGIGGIPTPGNKKVSPTTTTTYTLTATGCGGVATSQVTVNVNPGAPKTSEVSGKTSINAGGDGSADAECPSGSVVTAGGFEFPSSSTVLVYNSYKSGNGWHVTAKNSGAAKITLTAYATCLSNTSGSTTQATRTFTVPANNYIEEYIDCPSGSVITSGGFAYIPSGGKAYLQYSPGSWEIHANNTTGAPQTLNGHSICLTGANVSTKFAFSKISVAANSSGSVTGDCPSGTVVTGGGSGYSPITGTTLVLSHKNGNGWQVSLNNATAAPQEVGAYPVCATFKP